MVVASVKSLTLLLAAAVGSTTNASNLRGRQAALLQHPRHIENEASSTATKRYVRNPSASASIDGGGSSGVDKAPAAAIAAVDAAANPPSKFQEVTKEDTERRQADVPKSAASAARALGKIVDANALELSSEAVPSARAMQDTTPNLPASYIASDKTEYEEGDAVSIEFALPMSGDVSDYKIGIFMRMAHPQGGALRPIVSLPLCSQGCNLNSDPVTGSVTFNYESMRIESMPAVTEAILEEVDGSLEVADLPTAAMREGSNWPIDPFTYGTGFDAYVLDGTGDDVVGPVKFNINIDE